MSIHSNSNTPVASVLCVWARTDIWRWEDLPSWSTTQGSWNLLSHNYGAAHSRSLTLYFSLSPYMHDTTTLTIVVMFSAQLSLFSLGVLILIHYMGYLQIKLLSLIIIIIIIILCQSTNWRLVVSTSRGLCRPSTWIPYYWFSLSWIFHVFDYRLSARPVGYSS